LSLEVGSGLRFLFLSFPFQFVFSLLILLWPRIRDFRPHHQTYRIILPINHKLLIVNLAGDLEELPRDSKTGWNGGIVDLRNDLGEDFEGERCLERGL
jgi:hypothetical protein